MIRLLQFSDIHFLYCDDTEDEYAQMRQRFKEDLTHLKDRVGVIPYVLICGDIANKGQKQEFDKARDFIKDISEILKVEEKQPDVFVVPGNHDINRNAYKETRNLLRQKLLKFELQENERFMQTLRHNETDTLRILYSSLSVYNDFATEFSSVDCLSETLMEGNTPLSQSNTNLFWKRTIGKLENYAINIIGLNSTLLCDGKEKIEPDGAKGEHTLFLPFMAYNKDIAQKEQLKDDLIAINKKIAAFRVFPSLDAYKEQLKKQDKITRALEIIGQQIEKKDKELSNVYSNISQTSIALKFMNDALAYIFFD